MAPINTKDRNGGACQAAGRLLRWNLLISPVVRIVARGGKEQGKQLHHETM